MFEAGYMVAMVSLAIIYVVLSSVDVFSRAGRFGRSVLKFGLQASLVLLLVAGVAISGWSGLGGGVDSVAKSPIQFDFPNLEDEIAVQQVLANAVASEHAVLLLNVNWMFCNSSQKYSEVLNGYYEIHPNAPVQFHYVDVTSISAGYGPIRQLPGMDTFFKNRRRTIFPMAVIWMRNGIVVDVHDYGWKCDLIDFQRRTDQLVLK